MTQNPEAALADELAALVHEAGNTDRVHGEYDLGDTLSRAIHRQKMDAAKVALANHVLDQWGPILAALRAKPAGEVVEPLHIVFDGPPGPEAGRFVECETPDGRSVNAGEWHERPDGYWELRIAALATPDVGEAQP